MEIPDYIKKYFWGDDLNELNWEKHQDYITKTILERRDLDSVHWLFEKTERQYLKNIVKTKKLDKKSQNFWNIYLS